MMHNLLFHGQPNAQGAVMLCWILTVFIWCYYLIRLLELKVFRKQTAGCILCTAFSIFFYFLMRRYRDEMNAVLTIGGFLLQILLLWLTARYTARQHRLRLSAMSFKEAFDSLPTGLCFYLEGGMTRLVNPQMEHIFRMVTGGHLSNAAEFFDALRNKAYACSASGGETPIICLPDGTAFGFTHHVLEYQGETLHELIAADITGQYQMTLDLERKQKDILIINKRLKAINSTMRFVIMEKEILAMKTRVHDELGAALLMSRRYLLTPDEVRADGLLSQWKTSFGLLRSEARETWQKPYLVNLRKAELLGVQLTVHGRLPEEEHLIRVIDTAIAVHTTNVLRHAEGTRAEIEVTESRSFYTLRFSNNGRPPQHGVREGSGLSNLRHLAERAGGGMKIQALPRFSLLLRLPKRKPEGLQ